MEILNIKGLQKSFTVRQGMFAQRPIKVLDDIHLALEEGSVLGLVGESGSGKTTLARTLMRLVEPDCGEIIFRGSNIEKMPPKILRKMRKNFQMIFQDPYSSLNPRMRVFDLLKEPLVIHGISNRAAFRERVADLLQSVGLRPDMMDRFPHEFSGGQRQRIGIARALAVEPQLLVGDEPVSALDVSVQAQIINLLMDLRRKKNLSMIIISHDLKVVERMSDKIAVMYFGKIVEKAGSRDLIGDPLHPYTQALISAVPAAFSLPTAKPRQILGGDIPSFQSPPSGCSFHPRCPLVQLHCKTKVPVLEEKRPGHWVACHEIEAKNHD